MGLGYLRQVRLNGRLTPRLSAVYAPFAALALILFPSHAFAQAVGQYDSDTANTQVALLDPGSVANTRDMNFGQIAQSNTPGTVTLTPAYTAVCTVTGGLVRNRQWPSAEVLSTGPPDNKVRLT